MPRPRSRRPSLRPSLPFAFTAFLALSALSLSIPKLWLGACSAKPARLHHPSRRRLGTRASQVQVRAAALDAAASKAIASASASPAIDSNDWFPVISNVTITGISAAEAFAIYSHLPNHPQWSSLLEEVAVSSDPTVSRWSLRALGLGFSWDSRTTEETPPRLLAWESISGLPNRGLASFEDVPGTQAACRVTLEMNFQMPAMLRPVFESDRLSRMASSILSKDLVKFGNVVRTSVGTSRNSSRSRPVEVKQPLVNVTRADKLGSMQGLLWKNGSMQFKVSGFGTKQTTQEILEGVAGGMPQLPPGQRCRGLVDLISGVGCSPAAVGPIVRFLQDHGASLASTAVVGPWPLVKFAQFIASLAKQPRVGFFTDEKEALEWIAAAP